MAKQIKGRMAQKIDSLENWKKATGFIPDEGEFFLVKDYNFPIIIGDGVTNASVLSQNSPDEKVKTFIDKIKNSQ